jgi:Xaa-Pro aminopeptidase
MNELKQNLIKAEEIAANLFKVVEEKGWISAGKTEEELNTQIFELAEELYGIKKYWHKRIVRSGKNTLLPYFENPPNLTLQENDILFFDFGPIVEEWEADFGRTYVLGNEAIKHKLKQDIESAWQEARDWFFEQTTLSGSTYYHYICGLAKKYGWEYGGELAGHLIGQFPHERLEPKNYGLYVHAENPNDMFALDANGNKREWILEIHFVDREREIGGFFEQLLR